MARNLRKGKVMPNMTWKEFVDFVNKDIKKQGFDENVEIEYIDISNPDLIHESSTPYITIDRDGLAVHT